ncbi:hypothetical protein F4861DRAFT_62235 [Xylaria intraflava]|nr:hypothetical protein F4861DRAFT_62235 [Xylaria intraflava]
MNWQRSCAGAVAGCCARIRCTCLAASQRELATASAVCTGGLRGWHGSFRLTRRGVGVRQSCTDLQCGVMAVGVRGSPRLRHDSYSVQIPHSERPGSACRPSTRATDQKEWVCRLVNRILPSPAICIMGLFDGQNSLLSSTLARGFPVSAIRPSHDDPKTTASCDNH